MSDKKMMWTILLYAITLTTDAAVYGSSVTNLDDGNHTDNLIKEVFEITTRGFSQEDENDTRNSTANLRMNVECDTPNDDTGICLGIKQCPKLLKQLANMKARKFLRDSVCGPYNEDKQNPRVCCGKYDNYINDPSAAPTGRKVPVYGESQKSFENVFPKNCGTQRKIVGSRIMGGTEAALGEFPWLARLRHKKKRGPKMLGCSGFLIHPKYVLTAAHCVDQAFVRAMGPLHSVILGEHDSDKEIDCEYNNQTCADAPLKIAVNKVIIHPSYDSLNVNHYNDIALVFLNKGAKLSGYVQPICLLTNPNFVPRKYSLSGWGQTAENVPMSPIKMKIEIPSADRGACKESYSSLGIELARTQLCAGGESGRDSCNGDSGGPLMLALPAPGGPPGADVWYAAGVVSFGIGCGNEGWPGVYTKVAEYAGWVGRKMAETQYVEANGGGRVTRKRRREGLRGQGQ